jgi:tetratricopeptide (TPR) repeat protein
VREIQKEVDADPTDLAMRLQLAYAYQEDGRFEDALREYEQVLMLESEDTAALYNKGVVLLELGRDQEGEDALIMVLGIASDHVLAAKTLAQHYLDSDEPGAALAVIEPIVAEREEYADLQYIGGAASEALGRVDDAVAYYMRALKYAPDLVEARNGLERLGPDAGTP